jgi:hypothetical protein
VGGRRAARAGLRDVNSGSISSHFDHIGPLHFCLYRSAHSVFMSRPHICVKLARAVSPSAFRLSSSSSSSYAVSAGNFGRHQEQTRSALLHCYTQSSRRPTARFKVSPSRPFSSRLSEPRWLSTELRIEFNFCCYLTELLPRSTGSRSCRRRFGHGFGSSFSRI